MSSNGSKSSSPYRGDLQDRLRKLAIRTSCPTRQENGQRYLGPPTNWIGKPPQNSEVFISKLPADCFEDEIFDFCKQAGDIYVIRLMINFENENRGFCFVTFASPKQAAAAVVLLPQKPLRKCHFVHAEISLNNCSLKMYGLDYRFNNTTLENEIRMNTKDVVNVVIKRNPTQRTLMATLYFDTHQKAAIARRKLSQIANSRWGQNVKVFLWSKKLQNKHSNHKDNDEQKNQEFTQNVAENQSCRRQFADLDVNSFENEKENVKVLKHENFEYPDFLNSWMSSSPDLYPYNSRGKNECFLNNEPNNRLQEYDEVTAELLHDSNNNYSTLESFPNLNSTMSHENSSPPTNYSVKSLENEYSLLLSPQSDETLPSHSTSTLWDFEHLNHLSSKFSKSEYSLLDFSSSYDSFSQNNEQTSLSYSPNRQIEQILNEASEALSYFSFKD